MNFFIHRDGQNLGPYSEEEVRTYLQSGNLLASDLAWHEGAANWRPLSEMPAFGGAGGQPAPDPAVQYHHVAIPKFILLSIFTLGVYEIYWFYKNWKFIRQRDQSTIWPFWRAIFSHLLAYWCYRDVQLSRQGTVTALAGLSALVYFLMYVTWKLPDPWWLISTATFIPLLPMALEINRLNRENNVRSTYYSKFHLGHGALCLVGGCILALGALPALQVIPSNEVVPGDKLPRRTVEFLRENGVINDSETILYFYSSAFVSIRTDGNLLTDQRVISYYWDGELDDLVIESAFFHEIADVDVLYSTTFLNDTEIYIETEDETDFLLYASPEQKGDRKFVDKLNELRKTAVPSRPGI